jgi:hypothetical protein
MVVVNSEIGYPIFVIADLQRRPSSIISQLSAIGISFNIIPSTFISEYPVGFNPERCQALSKRVVTLSEVGCALSHLASYRELLKSDHQYAYVFEDDASFLDGENVSVFDYGINFIESVKTSSNQSNLLLLHTESANLKSVSLGGLKIFRAAGNPSHSLAYLISRQASVELIESNQNCDYVADWPRGTDIDFYCSIEKYFAHGSKNGSTLSMIEPSRSVKLSGTRWNLVRNIRDLTLVTYFANRKYFLNLDNYFRIIWWPFLEWKYFRFFATPSEVWGPNVYVK